jgi:hypothetical protein
MQRIDKEFVDKWHPQYAENDEQEYEWLVEKIGREATTTHTLSEQMFKRLFKWKTRNRPVRFLRLSEYQTLYAPAFARCLALPKEQKLGELAGNENKLPGIGTATATTVIHFLHPREMPIMDIRTVEVLHEFGYITADKVSFDVYDEFCRAIESIARELNGPTYRQIDRALFAYHKREMTPVKSSCN